MFQDLGQIFEIQELSDIAKKFLQSIQYTEGTKLRNKEKLNLLQKMVSSDLFVQKGLTNVWFFKKRKKLTFPDRIKERNSSNSCPKFKNSHHSRRTWFMYFHFMCLIGTSSDHHSHHGAYFSTHFVASRISDCPQSTNSTAFSSSRFNHLFLHHFIFDGIWPLLQVFRHSRWPIQNSKFFFLDDGTEKWKLFFFFRVCCLNWPK